MPRKDEMHWPERPQLRRFQTAFTGLIEPLLLAWPRGQGRGYTPRTSPITGHSFARRSALEQRIVAPRKVSGSSRFRRTM